MSAVHPQLEDTALSQLFEQLILNKRPARLCLPAKEAKRMQTIVFIIPLITLITSLCFIHKLVPLPLLVLLQLDTLDKFFRTPHRKY